MLSDAQDYQIEDAKKLIPPHAHNVEILESEFTTDVFLRYQLIYANDNDEAEAKEVMKRIDFYGNVQDDPKMTMHFDNLADRVHFFSSLRPVKQHG